VLVLGIAAAVAVVILGVAVLMPPALPPPPQLYVKVVPNGASYLLYVNDSGKAIAEVWYSRNGGPLLRADGPIRAGCGDRVEFVAVYEDGSRQTAAAVVKCTTPFKALGGGGGPKNLYIEPEVEKLFRTSLQVTAQTVDIVGSGGCNFVEGSAGFRIYYRGLRLNVPVVYEAYDGNSYIRGVGLGEVVIPLKLGILTHINITPLIPPPIGTVGDYVAGKKIHFKAKAVKSLCRTSEGFAPCCYVFINGTEVFFVLEYDYRYTPYNYTRETDAPFDVALEYGYQSPDGKRFYKATIMAYMLNSTTYETKEVMGYEYTVPKRVKRWSIFAAHSPALGSLSEFDMGIELYNGSGVWKTNLDIAACNAAGYGNRWLECVLDMLTNKKTVEDVPDWAFRKVRDFFSYVARLPNGTELLFFCAFHNCTDVWVRRDVVPKINVTETAYHVIENQVARSSTVSYLVQALAIPGALQVLVDNPTFPDVHVVLNFNQLLVNMTCQTIQTCLRPNYVTGNRGAYVVESNHVYISTVTSG